MGKAAVFATFEGERKAICEDIFCSDSDSDSAGIQGCDRRLVNRSVTAELQ